MRVRFAGYGIYVFGERDAFAGETGHRQVEAVPEEVHGALLAVKPPGVFFEDLIRPGEYAVEAPHVRLLAGGVIGIVLQSVLVVEVEGPSVYGNVYPRRAESLHKLAVELRDGKIVYREPSGGITMSGKLATQVAQDPRVHLVGYGPSASTIGANRAGRAAAKELMTFLEGEER